MKAKIFTSNTISYSMLIAVFAVVITSCQKTDLDPLDLQDGSALTESKVIPAPDVPDIIKVPAGNRAIWHAYATGVQIYQVTQSTTDPNVYVWTFIEPSATLYSDPSLVREVGIHYIGPTWKATTGPKEDEFVVGLKLQSVTEDVSAIPWLLLSAVPNADPNYYSEITYIQRVNTTGGLAPTTGADADHLGVKEEVPYTAEYYFYGAK